MTEFQVVIYAILFVEIQIIGLFVILLIIGNVAEWVHKKLYPVYPYCDIDPRCHSAFAWDKAGNGRIGPYLVIPTALERKGFE